MAILHCPYLFLVRDHGMEFVLIPAGEVDRWLFPLRYGFVYEDVSDARTCTSYKLMVDSRKVIQG